jgi:hypothetical protein
VPGPDLPASFTVGTSTCTGSGTCTSKTSMKARGYSSLKVFSQFMIMLASARYVSRTYVAFSWLPMQPNLVPCGPHEALSTSDSIHLLL